MAYSGSFRKSVISIILFIAIPAFVLPACNRKDIWDNDFLDIPPDVTITDVIADTAASTITLVWSEPQGDYTSIHVAYKGATNGDYYINRSATGTGAYTLSPAAMGYVYEFLIKTSGENESVGVSQNAACGIQFVTTGGAAGSGGGWFNFAKFNDPQAAIEVAFTYATALVPQNVWIAGGVYMPLNMANGSGVTTNNFCLRDNVRVRGGFAGNERLMTDRQRYDRDGNGSIQPWEFVNQTIFSGDLDGNDDTTSDPDGFRIIFGGNAERIINGQGISLSGNVVMDGITITGASSKAVYLDTTSGPTYPQIVNCVIKQNKAVVGGTGAGVYLSGASAEFSGTLFINNDDTGSGGGAVYSTASIATEFNGCVFVNNRSAGSGGAVYSSGATSITYGNSIFQGNKSLAGAAGGGGAIYSSGNTATFTDITFQNNTANYNGGAIYFQSANNESLDTCRFIDNSSINRGGAVYTDNSETLSFTLCLFDNNGSLQGGAVFTNYPGATALANKETYTNSTFQYNDASGDGGAVYCVGTDYKTDLQYDNCSFLVNTAANGGGLYISNGTVKISNSTLSQNVASGGGGAIQRNISITNTSTDTTSLRILNSRLESNSASAGSAINIYNGSTNTTFTTSSVIINTMINSNIVSSGDGGGVFVKDGTLRPHRFFLINSLLYQNDSDDISRPSSLLFLTDSVGGGTTTYLYNNIFWRNMRADAVNPTTGSDYSGWQIQGEVAGSHQLVNCIVDDGTEIGLLAFPANIGNGGGCSHSDPKFVNEALFDFHIQTLSSPASPAEDTGISNAFKETGFYPAAIDLNGIGGPVDDISAFTDLDGNPREEALNSVNIGPYENN